VPLLGAPISRSQRLIVTPHQGRFEFSADEAGDYTIWVSAWVARLEHSIAAT
jgi:hypothetical protein